MRPGSLVTGRDADHPEAVRSENISVARSFVPSIQLRRRRLPFAARRGSPLPSGAGVSMASTVRDGSGGAGPGDPGDAIAPTQTAAATITRETREENVAYFFRSAVKVAAPTPPRSPVPLSELALSMVPL